MKVTAKESDLAKLRRDGCATLGPQLTSADILKLGFYFDKCAVFNAHVQAKAKQSAPTLKEKRLSRDWPMMCHAMRDTVLAPHLFELAISLYPFVQKYFDGEQPVLYSMNTFWTQPAPGEAYQDTHGWHRDGDDRKSLVMFMLMTDVMRPQDGAHLYQRGTHRNTDDRSLSYDFRQPPTNLVETIQGPAGTVFLTDTMGLHVGLRPQWHLRGLSWARWGVSNPPPSYINDRLEPVELKPHQRALLDGNLKDVVRLIAY